jgi:hypothetical protein
MSIQYRIIILGLFSLLSLGAVAGESYTCKLDAEDTGNWIPSSIQISFNDEKKVTKLYSAEYDDYDLDLVKVIRWSNDFREVKYINQHQTAEAGLKYRAIHTITILPKLNNKINYMLKFSHYSNHHNARGTCKKTELNQTKTKTKATLTCPANMKACASSFICNKATQKIGGKWSWYSSSSAFYKYVTEAKKRGLSCGVVSSNSNTGSTCQFNVKKCTTKIVCIRATTRQHGGNHWQNNVTSSFYKYFDEAKRRGLSCDGATVFTGKSESVQKNTSDIDQTKDRTTLAYKKLNGYGVAKDLRGALRLFLMSAKQGDANAQNWLGKMYHQGNGAIKNYKKAYMWFNIAHANGYTTAGSTRDLVGQSMSSSDVSAAQDKSSSCIESDYVDC